jgi:hypothetical protein
VNLKAKTREGRKRREICNGVGDKGMTTEAHGVGTPEVYSDKSP